MEQLKKYIYIDRERDLGEVKKWLPLMKTEGQEIGGHFLSNLVKQINQHI